MRRIATAALAALLTIAPAAAQNGRISLDTRDTDLVDVIRLMGAESGINLVADGSIKPNTKVTLRLRDVSFDEALATLTSAYNLAVHREGRVLILGDAASMNRRFADTSGQLTSQTVVFPLHNSRPEDVAAQLNQALPAGTVVVADKRSGAVVVTAAAPTVSRARRLVDAFDAPAYGGGSGITTQRILVSSQKASDAIKSLKGIVAESSVYADDRQNAIVVTGNAETIASVRQVLASLDVPSPQVMFEVRVADVNPINDASNVGFTFGGSQVGQGGTGANTFAFPVIPLVRNTFGLNVQLNTLISEGRASILAEPRIATLNNREAYLLVGESYPVFIANLQTGLPSVQTIDIGVKLRMTPTIGSDGSIIAELHPEYSQITGQVQQYPIVANRKVDSTLRVHDGETIVLGGLFSDVDSDTVTKFPFLGDIPVLGTFFRNRQRNHTRDELVFLITPHVM